MIRALLLACLLLVCHLGSQGYAADTVEDQLKACLQKHENNSNKRLECYDEIAGRKQKAAPSSPAAISAPAPQSGTRTVTPAPVTVSETPSATPAPAELLECHKIAEHDYAPVRLRCYDRKARYSSTSCLWQNLTASDQKAKGLEECKKICDDSERLAGYDELTQYPKPEKPSRSSYLEKLWLLDTDSRKNASRWAILSHRENYFLLYTYNGHLEKQTWESVNPGKELQYAEAKYQLSLKFKLWEDLFGKPVDFWAGYTQISLWQLYNWDYSAPFRETNYEPELIFNGRMDKELFDGWRLRFIQFVPLNHQSNGQSEPLSRSWNRSMLNFGVEKVNLFREKDNFDVLLKAWYRWPESADDDDNPSMSSYLGYGEIWAGYRWKILGLDYHLGLMFRNNLRFDDHNRSTVQLGFDGTLAGPLNWYVQYFTGYGETLIDYNHYTNRIGVGVMVKDW
jgi:phospholipase A1